MKKFILYMYILVAFIFALKYFAIDLLHWHGQNGKVAANQSKSYEIDVFLDTHMLYLFENNKLIKSYPIGIGVQRTPSHVGIWKITGKSDWGEGFGGTWMGLNIPWGKYGIHGTLSPHTVGDHATEGCIRMFNNDVKELADIVPIGTTVVISGGPFGAFGEYPRTIMPGDRGSDVLQIQIRLKALGLYKGSLDAVYTDELKNAVFAFQKSKGLKPHNDLEKWDLQVMGLGWFE